MATTPQPTPTDRSGLLLIVCGPSGVGKSTLCHHLLDTCDRTRFSISYTTRPPRGRERDGVDYHFVSQEAFEALIDGGQFAEWARVHGNYYGTHIEVVQESLNAGTDLLFDIDFQGAAQLREAFDGAVSVMVAPPSWEELERRLRARKTDSDEVIARRLEKARLELSQYGDFDFVLVNDDIARAKAKMATIYEAAQMSVAAQRVVMARLLRLPA